MTKLKSRRFWIAVTILVLSIVIVLFSPLANSVSALPGDVHAVTVLWRVRNEIMQKSPAGQYYEALFWFHSSEQVQLVNEYPEHRKEFWRVTQMFIPGLEALLDGKGDTVRITEEQVKSLQAELDWYASVGSPSLRDDIEKEQQRFPLENFVGMPMSEALDYINSYWPPDLTVESITPTEVATQTPRTIPTPICVAGFDSNCLAEPSLVRNSDGQWAYYIVNGVYFEYPSTWDVQTGGSYLYIKPAPDSSEASRIGAVELWVMYLPSEFVEGHDLLTFNQRNYITPIWEHPVSLPDFEGIEILWKQQNLPAYLEAFLYAENDQIEVVLRAYGIDDQIPGLIDNPNAVTKSYPEFQHIAKSFRIWKP